jgi:hypothetical protein
MLPKRELTKFAERTNEGHAGVDLSLRARPGEESPDNAERRIPITSGLSLTEHETVPQKITTYDLSGERVKTCGKSARLGHGDIPDGQTLRIVSPCKPVVETGSVKIGDSSLVTSEGWVLQVLSNQYRR